MRVRALAIGELGRSRARLASGSALDVTHAPPNIFHDFSVTNFLRLSSVFSVDFLDTRVSGMGSHIGSVSSGNHWPTLSHVTVLQDWVCPLRRSARASLLGANFHERANWRAFIATPFLCCSDRRALRRQPPDSHSACSSLSDTEAGKDPPEQIVRRELASDLGERLLSLAQFFRHQLAGAPLEQLSPRFLQMPIGARRVHRGGGGAPRSCRSPRPESPRTPSDARAADRCPRR